MTTLYPSTICALDLAVETRLRTRFLLVAHHREITHTMANNRRFDRPERLVVLKGSGDRAMLERFRSDHNRPYFWLIIDRETGDIS